MKGAFNEPLEKISAYSDLPEFYLYRHPHGKVRLNRQNKKTKKRYTKKD